MSEPQTAMQAAMAKALRAKDVKLEQESPKGHGGAPKGIKASQRSQSTDRPDDLRSTIKRAMQ